ncbi:hypothetical protein [Pinibacter soli]|uniref:TMF family protein n=1 Tax=Pinibacter soli TaxID=3044211 RepID=A0ABT6RFP4_9BACT|nr:hypothetical protein [Pinibacter soli]MDI3321397.1 hypothetical protein [Pinibacter soli]
MKKAFLLILACSAYFVLFSQNAFLSNGNVLINTSTDNGNQLQVNGSATITKDIIVNGITVGKGAGNLGQNTALGSNALMSNTGAYNTAIGYSTLVYNTTGIRNTAVGVWALPQNTTGNYNTAVGFQTLYNNSTGVFNAAFGHAPLYSNTTGNGNIAFGQGALFYSTGSYNIGLGYRAGFNQSAGDNNIIIAANAAFPDLPNLTGSNQLNIGNIIYGTGVNSSTIGAGNIGIGTTSPSEKLSVNGNIRSKKVIVTQSDWADYVFEPSYKLPSLDSVSSFIKANKHLPEIPSAAAIEKDGQDVGEIQKLLLKKVEELTLYVIELRKENKDLKKEILELKAQK